MAKVQVKATHEFWAENDAELSFQQGDIITVLNKDDPGWWEGELNGQRGLFPSNYVEVLKPGAGGGPKPPGAAKPPGPASNSRQSANNVVTKAPAKTSAVPAKVTGAGVIKLGGGNTNGTNGARGAPPSARPPASSNAGPKPPSSAPSGPKPPSSPKNAPATRIAGEYKGGVTGTDTVRVGASGGAKANVEKGKDSKTKIGLWASSMAYCTAFAGILFGLCGIPWGVEYQSRKDLDIFCAFYLIIVSVGIIAYEKYFGGNRNSRGAGRVPLRGMVFIALGIFPLYSEVTLIPAGFLFITGFVNIIACLIMAENYSEPPKQAKAAKESNQQEADGVLDSIVQYATMVKEQNKVGTLVFLALYVLANFVIFVTVLLEWNERNRALAVQNRLSGYGPVAKAFGNLLDFNCSIIVLPVLRSFIRSLYNMSTADQGCFAKMLRFILLFVPLDRALEFHKLISKMIVFSVIGHTVMHFFNYSFRPTQTMNLFGLWPWYSGALILFCMLMIYSGTREVVKRGQFEIFWYNHHFFIGFWGLLLTHGNGGVQINFMKWFAGPGSLYLMERILRIYRANLPVVVLSVNIMRPCVFSLEFDKAGVFAQPYKEGQYIFINAPTVAFFEWHPFTISSAPEEKSVTVHIRTQGKGTWTERLMNKFEQMGPKQAYFRLNRAGPQGQIPGKILGPEGKPLLSIDGPHSAPTQHVGEYSVAMVVGAGIGVTPVGSVLKSVVFHKWKYYIGQCFPDHAYFLWVCGYQDLDAFRWLVRVLKDAQDEIVHMRYNNPENMATKTFQCHIWITSVPKDAKPVDVVVDDEAGFWGVPREDAKVEKVRANFAEEDLYRVMKCPGKHTQLGDIHIWNGRPEWEPRFEEVAKNHPKGDVGVTFCGNPFIAKDLAKNCHMASHGRKDGIFVLHKENF